MIVFLQVLMLFSFFLAVFLRFRKNGVYVFANQLMILNLFFLLYLVFPSFFFDKINYFYSWGIQEQSFSDSFIYIFYYFVVIFVSYLISSDTSRISFDAVAFNYSHSSLSVDILKYLYWIVFIYSSMILIVFGKDIAVYTYTANSYTGEQPLSLYKIKNIAYLSIFITTILYSNLHSNRYLLLSVLLIVLDLLQGTRTIAFISFVNIYILVSFRTNKLYLKFVFIFIFIITALGYLSRSSILDQIDVPWYLNAIGEFKETYITLPYLINNDMYVGQGDYFAYIGFLLGNVFQFFIDFFHSDFIEPARQIVLLVDRGYGLGSNLISEALYFGQVYTIIYPFIIVLIAYLLNRCIYNSRFGLMLLVLSIVTIRLGVREGFLINITYSIYFVIFYWGLVWFCVNLFGIRK